MLFFLGVFLFNSKSRSWHLGSEPEGLRVYGCQIVKLQRIPGNTKYNLLAQRRKEFHFQGCVGEVSQRGLDWNLDTVSLHDNYDFLL